MGGVAEPKPEVRRCARCHQPTLVRVTAWIREVAGLQLGAYETDFRCESCGYRVTLHAQRRIQVQRVFGYVFLIAIFPGLFFLWRARTWERDHLDNPIVDGAPVSSPTTRPGPGDRTCGRCGNRAVATAMSRHAFGVVRGGLEFRYACQGCGVTFRTASPGGLLFWVAAGALTASLTAAIVVNARTTVDRLVWGGVFALLTLFSFGSLVARVLAARRNPEL